MANLAHPTILYGYLFFQNATLPKLETKIDTVKVSTKETLLSKKINQIGIGENVILKGQILNKENNEPIPFATLILKREEIYRKFCQNRTIKEKPFTYNAKNAK